MIPQIVTCGPSLQQALVGMVITQNLSDIILLNWKSKFMASVFALAWQSGIEKPKLIMESQRVHTKMRKFPVYQRTKRIQREVQAYDCNKLACGAACQ